MIFPINVLELCIVLYAISGISSAFAEDQFILQDTNIYGKCPAGWSREMEDCRGFEVGGKFLTNDNQCSADGYIICTKPSSPGAQGDPHFRTWSGERYDFHGVCDLVMLSNRLFENGLGMDIHLRTEKMRMWSYISSIAIRIGKDILEIGGKGEGLFIMNGITHHKMKNNNLMIADYPIHFTKTSKKQNKFELILGEREMIVVETWNSLVSIFFVNPKDEHFMNSYGLMGSYPDGQWVARDNKTIIDNAKKFGQEWQVLAYESKLFHKNGASELTIKKCEAPSNVEMRRRLGQQTMTQHKAKMACLHVKADDVDLCIFDVIATNDVFSAGAY